MDTMAPNKGRRKPNHRRQKRPDLVVFPPDPRESGKDVVNRIYKSFGLSDTFPPDCVGYVKEIISKDPCDDPKLKDYTDKPFITIDNDHSMDLDQAMYISRANPPHMELDTLGYCVSYALADGAYFVPPIKSPLFHHALEKGGTSFYLPGKCIPMLPRELSEDVMSLNEGVKRRALIFDMHLDAQGNPIKTFYCWGVILSRWKGTYREVSDYYEAVDLGQQHEFLSDKDFTETIELLREVGILRRKLASDREVCDYNRGDHSGITMDDKGNLVFSKSTQYISELYNEQISLLCNSEGAKILFFMDSLEEETGSKDILHPIYRSQSGPREEQVEILEAVIKNTLTAHQLDASMCWKKDSQSIASYLGDLRAYRNSFPESSKEYREWSAVLMVIERQAMITNVKASYSAEPEGHHSLKISHYARFSSPMRELVGCFTHKELFEANKGDFQSSKMTSEADIILRDQVIRAARRARFTQKKLSGAMRMHMLNVTFYKDLKKRIDHRPVHKGIILGIDFAEQRDKTRRAYVKLEEPSIEIKVYGEDLDYHYGCKYGAEGGTLGRFGTTSAIAPIPGSFAEDADDDTPPTFLCGSCVTIRVGDYARYYGQTSRSRWIFIMDIDEPVGEPQKKRSVLRNSIVDRDLKLLLDQESESFGDDAIFETLHEEEEDSD